jgi:hypothetical protein
MPIETALVLAAIVAVFGLFAGSLAWGDYCTRTRNHDGTPAEWYPYLPMKPAGRQAGPSHARAHRPRETRWNYSMPDLIQTGNSNKRQSGASIDAAPAAEPRERFDAALKAIGQHKSKAELDAEAEAEARLNKGLSQFGSKE